MRHQEKELDQDLATARVVHDEMPPASAVFLNRSERGSEVSTVEQVQARAERSEGRGLNQRSYLGALAIAPERIVAEGSEPGRYESDPRGEAFQSGSRRRIDSRNAGLVREIGDAKRDPSNPRQGPNNDEILFANKIGSYTKGLPHDPIRGEVEPEAYGAMISALASGRQAAFADVPRGCSDSPLQRRFASPLAGLAVGQVDGDLKPLMMPPAPGFSSAEEAGEIIECYWHALLRDVPFSEYDASPLAREAATDLNGLSDFRGPKAGGKVTPRTLFRGTLPGDLQGPYVSQFRWLNAPLGSNFIDQRVRSPLPRVDYVTSFPRWLLTQDGYAPSVETNFLPGRRFIANGRDLGEQVHHDMDVSTYYHYLSAFAALIDMKAPLNPGHAHLGTRSYEALASFGSPQGQALLAEAATRALEAMCFQKWYVHRRSRPEDFAGRLHLSLTDVFEYPIHADAFTSSVFGPIFEYNAELNGGEGTFLLPQAYPEGSPMRPSYGQSHGVVAGACVTMLKAFFDESFVIPHPVVPDPRDADRLIPFHGRPLTVGGELNKLASNTAMGRNFAGVHFRSDARASLLLGESVALGILRDRRPTFAEDFNGVTFTTFSGDAVTV